MPIYLTLFLQTTPYGTSLRTIPSLTCSMLTWKHLSCAAQEHVPYSSLGHSTYVNVLIELNQKTSYCSEGALNLIYFIVTFLLKQYATLIHENTT